MSDMSPEAKALLDSAIPGLEPDDDARVRVRARIAAQMAVGLAAGAAVVAASKSTAGATAATIAGGAASAGGASIAAGAGAAATGAAATGAAATGAAGAAAASGAAGIGAAGAGAAVTMGVTTKVIASLAVVSAVSVGTITYTQTKRAEPAPIAATAPTTAAPVARARVNDTKAAPRVANGAADPSADPAADPNADPNADPTSAPDPTSLAVVAVAPTSAPLIPTPPILPAPASSATLAAEVALLKQANAQLAGGDPARALALLDEHRRLYPRGALVEERDAARVLALCGAGRHSEGIAARGRFLREHPSSPQLARVQNACATPGSGIQRDFPQ